jgi:hypothetical protein
MGSWTGICEEVVVSDGRRDCAYVELLEKTEGRGDFGPDSTIIVVLLAVTIG